MPPDAPDSAERADTAEFTMSPASPGSRPLALDVGAHTHPGRVRAINEDAYAVFRIGRYVERVASSLKDEDLPEHTDQSAHVMIVADGIGGHEGGEVASRTALLATMRFILETPKWSLRFDDPATRAAEVEEVRARAAEYFKTVHDELRQIASSRAELAGMGTTLTVAYVVDRDLFVLHVGDSKAYLLRGGALRQVTHDHTVAQEYADMGLIPQEEVPKHRMQHVLTRAVGGPEERLQCDFELLRLEPGDRLLLCSDGLTDMTEEGEIAAILAEHASSDAACRALVDRANERGGRDNVTVILAGFS